MTLEEVKEERRSHGSVAGNYQEAALDGAENFDAPDAGEHEGRDGRGDEPDALCRGAEISPRRDGSADRRGEGHSQGALRIKERAYDLRIAVREDRPLARGLYKYGKVDQPIPSIFYQGVAIILAALYRQGFQASDAYWRPPKRS